jgi:hypothetical protein
MKKTKKKGRKWLIALGVILCLAVVYFIIVPMNVWKAPPGRLFDLDADEVEEIAITYYSQGIIYDEPEEIEAFVQRLNDMHLKSWIYTSFGQSECVLRIRKTDGSEESYSLTQYTLRNGNFYFATSEDFSEEMALAKEGDIIM